MTYVTLLIALLARLACLKKKRSFNSSAVINCVGCIYTKCYVREYRNNSALGKPRPLNKRHGAKKFRKEKALSSGQSVNSVVQLGKYVEGYGDDNNKKTQEIKPTISQSAKIINRGAVALAPGEKIDQFGNVIRGEGSDDVENSKEVRHSVAIESIASTDGSGNLTSALSYSML